MPACSAHPGMAGDLRQRGGSRGDKGAGVLRRRGGGGGDRAQEVAVAGARVSGRRREGVVRPVNRRHPPRQPALRHLHRRHQPRKLQEVSALVALKSLNLSWNNFNGKIPGNVGNLMQVESLDLSHNALSGEIPSSLSALTSLSCLNLSYNNMSGKIPTGNQLQTLEDPASIYIGNPGLCGPPLSQECSSQPEPLPEHHEAASDDMVSFFLAMGYGCVVGLWVVFLTLLFKRNWRASWYALYDGAYVQVAVTWASLRGKLG